mmetsp:Transcript_48076/g.102267  ORF Transcript_48076/g.102267 Transcript_48076/m.102267 type:complete len:411 (-) Transcript_48076:397-1629(-)
MQNHQLHAGISPLERVPHALQLLHPIQDDKRPLSHELVVPTVHVQIQLLDLAQNVLPAAQLADENPQLVPHRGWVDVLVRIRAALQRGNVQSALVGEGRRANVGRRPVGGAVQGLVQEAGQGGYVFEVVFAGHSFAVAVQGEGRNDGAEVGIPSSFADAVDCALDETHARLDGSEAVGHGKSAIIVAMNAKGGGFEVRERFLSDLFNLPGHGAAISVAHDKHLRPSLHRRLTALHRVPRIELVPVEEVLQIHHDRPPLPLQILHRILDHLQILLGVRAEYVRDLPEVRLGHDAHARGVALHQLGDLGIVGGPHALASGAPERHQLGAGDGVQFGPGAGKELLVLGIGAGPPGLYIIHVKLGEPSGDLELVVARDRDGFHLSTVAEGGVVDEGVGRSSYRMVQGLPLRRIV